jgi:type VI secretion system protein ImpA
MVEIEPLLNPIEEDNPSGRNLRDVAEDMTFQTLKDLTTVVDAAVAASEDEIREANWPGAAGLCYSALAEKSKDLELIASLCEAWVHTEGVEGIPAGLELLHQCMQRFWPTLNPGLDPDDGEISYALRARWLNYMDAAKGYLTSIKQAPLLQVEGGQSYSWSDHENSAMLEDATTSPERRDELIEAGVISDAQWQAAVGATAPAKLRQYVDALGRGAELARSLGTLCSSLFDGQDEDAPDFYNLLNTLEELHDYFGAQVGEDVGDESALGEVGDAQAAQGGPVVAGGPIGSRQAALKQLQEVGDYFKRTEPHSPISYLIARAVKWGSMPLDQLFKDVVRNDDVLEHIWETLGLETGGDNEGDDY